MLEPLGGKHGDCTPHWQRKPRRITISLPEAVYGKLIARSSREGRSVSNLASYLLEETLSRLLHPDDSSAGGNAVNRGA